MKRIIKGDLNLSHLVIAHAAIDRHQKSYGERRQGWPSTYLVRYKITVLPLKLSPDVSRMWRH